MDTVSHALLGAVLGAAVVRRSERRAAMVVGALAAAFPDIDFVLLPLDPYRFHTEWHRGTTYSLVLLPLWVALLAWLLHRRSELPFPRLAALCALALASHIGADWITAYGIQLFYPLSRYRASVSLIFVIDPWFSAIVGLGTLLAWRWQTLPRFGTDEAQILWQLAPLAPFRRFADQPYLYRRDVDGACYWYSDLVFTLPGLIPPFRYGLCRDGQGGWRLAGLRMGSVNQRFWVE